MPDEVERDGADRQPNPPDDAGDTDADREDLNEMIGLIGETASQVRWGGLILGLGTAIAGVFLSREFGSAFLIGGVLLGLILGGGLMFAGSFMPSVVSRQIEKQEKRAERGSRPGSGAGRRSI
ncbi:MAG: hypothetical protein IJJ23_08645 [Clostridia bacterium]|nr:hypothetical protein [Clostridia bacterium]